MKTARPMLLLLAALALSCGYFNSMYNAQRRFSEAERLARTGDDMGAARAYTEAIEKAATSYRNHPDSRWADDAVLLIGRARFALREFPEARAAFLRLLEMEPPPDVRAVALAWLGAVEVELGQPDAALQRLDAALAEREQERESRVFALYWRARARFETGRADSAWADLDAVLNENAGSRALAALEGARRAVELGDSARLRNAFAWLAEERDAATRRDTVLALVRTARGRFTPDLLQSALEPMERAAWPATAREPLVLARLELLAEAGDTLNAVSGLVGLAERATSETAGQARVLAARLELAGMDSLAELPRARALLLPVLGNMDARTLIRTIETVQVLAGKAASEPLALFAAAELARDELRAPRLARRLFLDYAGAVPDAEYAPKALLAAAALSASPEEQEQIRKRFWARGENVYVRALKGGAEGDAFTAAENRLARHLAALRDEAGITASARDVSVGSAVARLDSLEEAARLDRLRMTCAALIDSLAVRGIRRDSVQAACMRQDSSRIELLLTIDTLRLRDTTRIHTLRTGRRPVRDTLNRWPW